MKHVFTCHSAGLGSGGAADTSGNTRVQLKASSLWSDTLFFRSQRNERVIRIHDLEAAR